MFRRPLIQQSRGRSPIGGAPGLLTDAIAQIGDSIVKGAGSTDDNGWRKAIHDHAVAEDYEFDFVGAFEDGAFADRAHDGKPGDQTSQILVRILAEFGPGLAKPGGKLIIINGGTNDVRQGGGQYSLPASMQNWTNELSALRTAWPFAKIIAMNLHAIDPVPEPTASGRVDAFNAGLVTVFDAFDAANPGNTLVRFDTHTILGTNYAVTHNADGFHWTDAGYALVAPELIDAADPYLAVEA